METKILREEKNQNEFISPLHILPIFNLPNPYKKKHEMSLIWLDFLIYLVLLLTTAIYYISDINKNHDK